MLTQLIAKPIQAAVALVELPLTARRSLEEVTELMEVSRRQLEAMQRQTDTALDQAERMNDLLARVVKLTEPLERAQKGSEYAAERIKRVIFGDEEGAKPVAEGAKPAAEAIEPVIPDPPKPDAPQR